MNFRIIKKVLSVFRIRYLEVVYLAPDKVVAPSGYDAVLMSGQDLQQLSKSGALVYGASDISRIDDGIAICIVAYFHGELAGVCWYAINDYPHSNGYTAHINPDYICGYGLRVMPAFQGKGVRAVLVEAALKWVKENGRKGVLAAITPENSASIRSARLMGYKKVGYSYFCRWLSVPSKVKHFYFLSSSIPNALTRTIQSVDRLGILNYAGDFFYSVLNRLGEFRIFMVYYFETAQTPSQNDASVRWVEGGDLSCLIDPDLEIRPDWVEFAINDQHKTVTFYDGGELKGYFWFSDRFVPTSARYFAGASSEYFYGYKAFTSPDVRGKGIFARLIGLALTESAKAGKKGIVTQVEWVNFSSRRAHLRAHAQTVGFHILIGLGPLKYIFNSPGCRKYGSCLVRR